MEHGVAAGYATGLRGDDAKLMRDVEHSGRFDFLFYGHTHVAAERRTGNTRVINPGALHRVRQKTFLVLHVERGVAKDGDPTVIVGKRREVPFVRITGTDVPANGSFPFYEHSIVMELRP